MRKTKSDLWNTYLCNRLSSIETNIRVARTVRLAVIATTIALFGVGIYLIDLSDLIFFGAIAIAIVIAMGWYFTFSRAFFQSDHVIKKYEDLILKNVRGELTENEIYKEYKMIQELEKGWGILILKGRFWRRFIKMK